MRETNASRLLHTLRHSPGPLCDDCVTKLCGFKHRQIAYQQAELLAGRRDVRREKDVLCVQCSLHKKCSWVPDPSSSEEVRPKVSGEEHEAVTEALLFEEFARQVTSKKYGQPLTQRAAGTVPKIFDLVSQDASVVGDAKFYSLVHGKSLPPAKFSTIAEHVWMLEKIPAAHRFLVFGNDRRVPEMWLTRYGHLVHHVTFYFLGPDGTLEVLNH